MMLTEEKQEMPSEMQDMMMNNEFVEKMHEKASAHSECAIMGLIKNQMLDLQEELKETKLKWITPTIVLTGNTLPLWIQEQDQNTQC